MPWASIRFSYSSGSTVIDHPQVLLAAYADNVFLSGRLSLFQAAYLAYRQAILAMCLLIIVCKSELYIPEWLQIPAHILQAIHVSILATAAPDDGWPQICYSIPMVIIYPSRMRA